MEGNNKKAGKHKKAKSMMTSPPGSPLTPTRMPQPSPKQGDRNYNRMKYYSSLKTDALRQQKPRTNSEMENARQGVNDWLDIPEHMLTINESAFVPAYGMDE